MVEIDEYAKELSRYIHLNPVRAGMVDKPEAYQWSSYPCYIGKKAAPEWLHRSFILTYFGETESVARKRYRDFVDSLIGKGYESPLNDVVSSTLLGSSDFISHIKETLLSDKKPDKNLPALKQLTPKASVQGIFDVADNAFGQDAKLARDLKMFLCHKYTEMKLRELGSHFGISESGICQASRRVSLRMEKDRKLRDRVEKLEKRIRLSRMKT